MSEVDIRIAGRTYRIGCGPGEETRVESLGARIDAEASTLQRELGQMPESRLLLLTALMLADKLDETETAAAEMAESVKAEVAAEAAQPTRPTAASDLFGHDQQEEVAGRMHGLAERIEGLVAQMRRPAAPDR